MQLKIREGFKTVRQSEEEAARRSEREWKPSFTGRLESELGNKGGFSLLGKIPDLTF